MEMFKTTHHIFYNKAQSTRTGFAHVTSMFTSDGVALTTARANYTNRTWERFTYQASMLNAVHDMKNSIVAILTNDFKQIYDIKRVTKHNQGLFAGFMKANRSRIVLGTTLEKLELTELELRGN